MPLAGRPMVEWSLVAFGAVERVRSIVVACPPGHVAKAAQELGGERFDPVRPEEPGSGSRGEPERRRLGVVEGGATRSQSVSNALAAVETELVAIHDAARPLVTPQLIEAVIATLVADPAAAGAIAAAPVADTIKRVAPAAAGAHPTPRVVTSPQRAMGKCPIVIEETVDRRRLWAAQTPQVFRTGALREALAAAERPEEATDEAMLVEAAGGRVLIHPSPPENLKVTTPLDLRLAELLLG